MLVRFAPVTNIVDEIDSILNATTFPFPLVKQFERKNRFAGVSMTDTGDQVKIQMELPGVQKSDVNVQVNDGRVVITAERKQPELKADEQWIRNEIPFGKIERSIELPYSVNIEKVSAVQENGILSIILPKHENAKPKQITIR